MAAAIAIAVGVWWNANTVSHLFIHRPFFRGRAANAGFAALLTAALGFPQALWRDRHLAHHRGATYRLRLTREIVLQGAVVASLWIALATAAPRFFAAAYLPGLAAGLLLCAIHGHYEHAGGTTSHYGRIYNAVSFNDGYHVEHHRHPGAPWWTLPAYRNGTARVSAWPSPLRWLDALVALERIVTRSGVLQRWVVRAHSRALEPLLAGEQPVRAVAIVGGGLFPRTALVLRHLFPDAQLTIVDASRENLDRARAFLGGDRVAFVHARVEADSASAFPGDVVVFPLAYDGDRAAIYARPPAPTVIVHDWIWRRRGTSRVVSLLLLKRMNVVHRAPETASA